MKISVIGSGYVGIVTGACFAELGNHVILVDVIRDKVEKINSGISPIYEEKLDRMLKKNIGHGRLHATTHMEKAILDTHLTFIAVGTPSKRDGSVDLIYIKKAAEEIGKALKKKDEYHTIVVKSTVIPGTTENVILPVVERFSGKKAGRGFGVAMNPEFLKEGMAVADFMNPDRVIIGAIDGKSAERVFALYRDFKCPVMKTNPRTAEMIKYASNAFLATKISFSNEIGNLCKRLGIDSYEVADGMGHDSRIERKFLNSGIGYGGSCFPKDVKAIIAKGKKTGLKMETLDAVESVNREQPLRLIEMLREKLPSLRGKKVAVLGLAFKPGTDDIREAPSLLIVPELLKSGASVKAYDPKAAENFRKEFPELEYMSSADAAIEGVDACLLLTEWDEFKKLTDEDFKGMRGDIIIEGRKILNPERVKFEGICW
ncbi:MAG: UDP-glucose/GDP-mannose dehydrogenase family protein [Candidatus Aenigmarchaeota archaeon]|nr:UDP-glucose/GDP-mannose dehydrogenase family protein [Candidatus Aenigmarchaeota archaeon]